MMLEISAYIVLSIWGAIFKAQNRYHQQTLEAFVGRSGTIENCR